MCGHPFAPIQILTGDTREGCAFRYRRLHDDGRSFRIKLRIERRFESSPGVQRVATLDLLETWSPCSRPFAILPVSAVSDAQKLATGNFLHVRACFLVLFARRKKNKTVPFREFRGFANLDSAHKTTTSH